MLRLLLLWFVVVSVSSCQKPETPPCVPQKPTGVIKVRNFFTTPSTPETPDGRRYIDCDTCFEDVNFLVEAQNYKSVVTRVDSDPRNFGISNTLRFPFGQGSYMLKVTLKNWGDCGSPDTLTTVLERFIHIGTYNMKRLHGTKWLGAYNSGRVDTVFIDTITRATALCCEYRMFNHLGKFPVPSCAPRVAGWNTGTFIYNSGNTLLFGNNVGSRGYCRETEGLGTFTDSTIYLMADTFGVVNFKWGFVSFRGRRIR